MPKTPNSNMIPISDQNFLEKLVNKGVFENYVTGWIKDCRAGILNKRDVVRVARMVASKRETPELEVEIISRLG